MTEVCTRLYVRAGVCEFVCVFSPALHINFQDARLRARMRYCSICYAQRECRGNETTLSRLRPPLLLLWLRAFICTHTHVHMYASTTRWSMQGRRIVRYANMYHMTMPLFVHVFGYVCIHKSVYIYVYIVCVCVCVRACVHRTSIGGGL